MRFWILTLCVLLTSQSFSLSSSNHSCRIQIQTEKKNGEHQTIQFSSPLKTKEACQTLAHIHRKNFDSTKIKTKRVTYFWKKVTKTVPMLAKAPVNKIRKSKRFNKKL
jgi:hypothetical protein